MWELVVGAGDSGGSEVSLSLLQLLHIFGIRSCTQVQHEEVAQC